MKRTKRLFTAFMTAIILVAGVSLSACCSENEKIITEDQGDQAANNMDQIHESTENGVFYRITEAHEKGYLTANDLMCISYYRYEAVWLTNGDPFDQNTWNKIDFCPQQTCPSLDIKVENDVKTLFYQSNKEMFFDQEGNRLGDENDLSIDFYGYYNGSYVVEITGSLWGYGTAVEYLALDNVVVSCTNPYFFVFRYE